MRSLTISGRVAITLLIMGVFMVSVLANKDFATAPDVTVMDPLIPESMLVASSGLEAHTSFTASLVTVSSVDIADFTSVPAFGSTPDPAPTSPSSDITTAPTESVHPDVIHPFEIEPRHTRPYLVGGLPVINAARDADDGWVSTIFVTVDVATVTVTDMDTYPCQTSAAPSAGQDDHALPAVDTTYNPSDVVGPVASKFGNSSIISAATPVGDKADLTTSTADAPDACALTTYTSTSILSGTSTSTFTSVASTVTVTAANSTTQGVGANDHHVGASTSTEYISAPTAESQDNSNTSAGSRRYEFGSQSSSYRALLAVIVCFVAGMY
ncbi:hypothetical protein KJ359_003448 [Pestalotiopsis sp. 9143b]|nr:hypothetical protein KJ359_003448 [Pestalotiopsis sp. 9143b]